jgi:hypothetical protein
MKKIAILIAFSILISGSALAFQETLAPATKKQPAKPKSAVDCSKVDNPTLAANVKDKLSNTASLKDYNITATAKDGNVTLTGSVKKATNKGLATRQTKRVPCVKSVDNQISIEGKPATEMK